MSRLQIPASIDLFPESSRPQLEGVAKKLGRVPNMMRTMAISPVVLSAYLDFSEEISASSLSLKLREQIALLIAEANECQYCLAAHDAVGRRAGLTAPELELCRRGLGSDDKVTAALGFAAQVLARKGHVDEGELAAMRVAGYSDAEILEVIACVALNVFTNFFNSVTEPEIDFPSVPTRAVLPQTHLSK